MELKGAHGQDDMGGPGDQVDRWGTEYHGEGTSRSVTCSQTASSGIEVHPGRRAAICACADGD